MQILSSYPWWVFIICVLVSAVVSGLLYFKDKNTFSKRIVYVLSALRFVSVLLMLFLLFAPLIKSQKHITENPTIVVLQDNSSSIIQTPFKNYYQNDYKNDIDKLCEKLSKHYQVEKYSFGKNLTHDFPFSFQEVETNISSAIDELSAVYEGRNLGALVIATDGIYNSGVNPVSGSTIGSFPIYSIALGDTNIRKDAIIGNVNFNKIAYLGNEFPIEVLVKANKLVGQKLTASVSHEGKVLFQKEIAISNDAFATSFSCILNADKVGLQRYKISISQAKDEISYKNNTQDIFIDVLDGRQKIALIANNPHPDIAAIKQAIESNKNYEIESSLVTEFKKNVNAFNLVIFHQLPNGAQSNTIIQKALEAKVPCLFILGEQTSIPELNNLQLNLKINNSTKRVSEATAKYNNSFGSFLLNENTKNRIEGFPPLLVPFGNYEFQNGTQTLFVQKIGSVETNMPLVGFSSKDGIRIGFIMGEGIWKWSMSNFALYSQKTEFNEFISKTVQYLAIKEDKSRFKITAKNIYQENEPIELQAEFYNENYEPINEPDVEISIYNKAEKNTTAKKYVFNKTSNSYRLNIGSFPVGTYAYTASVSHLGKNFSQKGEFIVDASNLEELNLVADHSFLNTLSQKTGGKMFHPSQMQNIVDELQKREDIKPVSFSFTNYVELLNLPWLFILIVILLGCEWFLRKFFGTI